jgi:hypothetical protein
MRIFLNKTILLTVLSLSSLWVFPQAKIAIYNGNSAQKEYKIFAASMVKSFTNSELEYEASDETTNINALLKQQGYKTKNKNVPDTIIAAACEKFEIDYVINFILYPEKTTKNVRVSLINANTFSVERTKTLTCNNLKNKAQVKQITDELVDYLLHKDLKGNDENGNNEENDTIAIAKQQSLNGHYISIGSSIFSSGYYGVLGLAYEYRYKIFGFNASVGIPYYSGGLIVNGGCKVYLANKIPFVRNLYFNINPFCLFGRDFERISEHYEAGDDYNIIGTTIDKRSPIFGGRIFFGYSPVWRVGKKKKVSLGFNLDIGADIGYRRNYKLRYERNYSLYYSYRYKDVKNWYPLNWDIGFIIKID